MMSDLRSLRIRPVLLALLALLALALACGGGGGPEEGSGQGIVRAIEPDRSRVTIEHGEIPGMMQAMTMTFEVADPALLEGVEPDDRVDFTLRHADGAYTLTAIDERS